MLQSFKAIVLGHIKYGESALITKFFTLETGLITVMCNGVRKPKSTTAGLLLPLSLAEIIVSRKPNQNMGTLKEIKNTPPLSNLNNQPEFGPLRIFMAALIEQFIQEEQEDPELLNYTWSYLKSLDQNKPGLQNVPLHFTTNLLKLVGYLPYPEIGISGSEMDEENNLKASIIQLCLTYDLAQLAEHKIDTQSRKACLNYLIHETANMLQSKRLKSIYEQLKLMYS